MDEEESLECPVCMDSYNEGRHTPKMMACLHTLCACCILDLATSVDPNRNDRDQSKESVEPVIPTGKTFVCPLCRENIITDRIQTNRYVLAHLRHLKRLEAGKGVNNHPLPPPPPSSGPKKISKKSSDSKLHNVSPKSKASKNAGPRRRQKSRQPPQLPKEPPPPPPTKKYAAPSPPTISQYPNQSTQPSPSTQHPNQSTQPVSSKYSNPPLPLPPAYNPYQVYQTVSSPQYPNQTPQSTSPPPQFLNQPNHPVPSPRNTPKEPPPSYNPYYATNSVSNPGPALPYKHPALCRTGQNRRHSSPIPVQLASPDMQLPTETPPKTPVAGTPLIYPKLPPATTFHQKNRNQSPLQAKMKDIGDHNTCIPEHIPPAPNAIPGSPSAPPSPHAMEHMWCRTCEEPGKVTCTGHYLVPLLQNQEIDWIIKQQKSIDQKMLQERKDLALSRALDKISLDTPNEPQRVEEKEVEIQPREINLSNWEYPQIRDTINTSCDPEMVMACYKEFDRRRIEYNRTIRRKKKVS